MRANNKKGNWPMRMAMLLLCLVLMTTSMLSGFYAKFTATADSGDSARVAQYAFEVQQGSSKMLTLDLTELDLPGDCQEVIFDVTNLDSEVGTEYEVAYSLTGNLPLTHSISGTKNDTPGTLWTSGSKGSFPAAAQCRHTYTLTLEWPSHEKDAAYSWEVDQLTITVTAQQIG